MTKNVICGVVELYYIKLYLVNIHIRVAMRKRYYNKLIMLNYHY